MNAVISVRRFGIYSTVPANSKVADMVVVGPQGVIDLVPVPARNPDKAPFRSSPPFGGFPLSGEPDMVVPGDCPEVVAAKAGGFRPII